MNPALKLLTAATLATIGMTEPALAQQNPTPFVRLATLDIDPAQMEQFNAAVKEGAETAVRVEPGVLALYAVAEKDNPNRVRVFELYTNPEAYRTHLQTPHFRKFRDTTDKMVVARTLTDGIPIVLGAKK
jgi:quinol monooxygenase YgiN